MYTQVINYSYREQAAYLTILYLALIVGIAYFLLRYANRSLFKWHTVSIFFYMNIPLVPNNRAHPTQHNTTQ